MDACLCPKCGELCDQESVDVGVGVIYGPYGCSNCGWSSDEYYDRSSGGSRAQKDEAPGRFIDQLGVSHSVVRVLETEGEHMSIEAGVLVGPDGPFYWHAPLDRNGGAIPDSQELWDQIWNNRDKLIGPTGSIGGFAHSHPGGGIPGPSFTDVTTFAAIEMALDERLTWYIVSSDHVVALRFTGPGKYDYKGPVLLEEPPWVPELRRLSDMILKA